MAFYYSMMFVGIMDTYLGSHISPEFLRTLKDLFILTETRGVKM